MGPPPAGMRRHYATCKECWREYDSAEDRKLLPRLNGSQVASQFAAPRFLSELGAARRCPPHRPDLRPNADRVCALRDCFTDSKTPVWCPEDVCCSIEALPYQEESLSDGATIIAIACGLTASVIGILGFMFVCRMRSRRRNHPKQEALSEQLADEVMEENTENIAPNSPLLKELSCPVCLDDFNNTSIAVVRPNVCSHFYHKDCLRNWVRHNRTCPMCKKDLVSETKDSVETVERISEPSAIEWNDRIMAV